MERRGDSLTASVARPDPIRNQIRLENQKQSVPGNGAGDQSREPVLAGRDQHTPDDLAEPSQDIDNHSGYPVQSRFGRAHDKSAPGCDQHKMGTAAPNESEGGLQHDPEDHAERPSREHSKQTNTAQSRASTEARQSPQKAIVMPKLQMHEMHELGPDGPQEELPQSIQIYDNDNDENNENDKEGGPEERARSSNMHSLL